MAKTSGKDGKDKDPKPRKSLPPTAKKQTQTRKESEALEQSFAAALRAAGHSPESDDAWTHLEELADELQRPDEVAELYRKMIDVQLPKNALGRLAQRAVQFHDDWFGDNTEAMSDLFTRILAADSEAEWAFERLTVVLTVAQKWDQLLSLYDKMLGITTDQARRRQLLDDAAHVAKDFADQPDRAVDYMKQLLSLDPDSTQLLASLERLFERQSRWQELIDLWRSRIPKLPATKVHELRVRIAACFLDKIGDPARALEELRTLVGVSPGHSEGLALLERILSLETAPAETRRSTLGLLRTNYDVLKRPDDVLRVLALGQEFADEQEWISLHRDAANRLALMGRDVEAMEHYSALVRKYPGDTEARKHLTELAQRSGRHDLQVSVLVEAAETCSDSALHVALLVDAARIHREILKDPVGAIDLYERVLAFPDADRGVALSTAHILNDLLAEVGRPEKRLAVLESIASLEQASTVRRFILGEAARLALEMGDQERALATWKSRLEADGTDLEAIDAAIALHEKGGQWDALVEALGRRASIVSLPQQRRADLVRMAGVQAAELKKPVDAVETWLKVRTEFGDEPETIAALDELMSSLERWPELSRILQDASLTERGRASALLARLGEVFLDRINQPSEAARFFSETLGVDPSSPAARKGLSALLGNKEVAWQAGEALARAYAATGDWKSILEILEPRLEAAPDSDVRARILREAASSQEKNAGDAGAALGLIARALIETPADLTLEKDFERLAEATGQWKLAAQTCREAAKGIEHVPGRAAQLRYSEGRILDKKVEDAAGAAQAYLAVVELDPTRIDVFKTLPHAAVGAGDWDTAASAVAKLVENFNAIDNEVLENLENAAEKTRQWDRLTASLTAVLKDFAPKLRKELIRDLELRIAVWHRDRRGDLPSAESAAQRAVEHDPFNLPGLNLLADIQRRLPGSSIVDTLLKIDALTIHNLDALHEAAEIMLRPGEDRPKTITLLQRLYSKATKLWSGSVSVEGERSAEASVHWALDQLSRIYHESGDTRQAAGLLLDGARLPFDKARSADMRYQAAKMMAETGEKGRAIELYNQVLQDVPTDIAKVREVAALCEQENRITDLLALRLRELDLTEDLERKLALRLDISALTGQFEEKGGRVETLKANLKDKPGHEESVAELSRILFHRGLHAELVETLEEQAKILEEMGDGPRASGLWSRIAAICDENLHDGTRAIAAYNRVVELACTNDALDALARLHLDRNEPAAAAIWLERRLKEAGPKERVAIMLKLARACLKADQPDRAVSSLESAFDEAPKNAEVRRLLLDLYRSREAWERLARTLNSAAEHVTDEATIQAYAREAYGICADRLGNAAQALPVLQKAYSMASTDKDLKRMLAESLLAAGQHDKARDLFTELVESFGRRRTAERAGYHLQLARVAHAQGNIEEALDQLETASKMDHGNALILKTMAELALEAGNAERAELAYRTLLLTVRRTQEIKPAAGQVGPAEVMLELSRISSKRGQPQQASELIESVIETITQNDAEAAVLQANMMKHEEHQLLHRVLETRLAHVKSARKKAEILSDLGRLLEGSLKRPEEALESMLRAIETDPIAPAHHEAAKELAVRLGKIDVYVSKIETMLDKARRDTDTHVRCTLMLRLGEVMEKEKKDLKKAAELYRKAEETGVRKVDVWRAAARVAGALGRLEEQMRLLNLLASMGEDQVETRAGALYSMAEVQLADLETLEEGLNTLSKAISENPRYERAGAIIGRASEIHSSDERILTLYEQIARKSGDEKMLLHYLERKAATANATPADAREAADLALKFEEHDRAEAIMLRAIDIGCKLGGGMDSVSWALLGLAQMRMKAGDLAGAVKWLSEAKDVAEPARVFELGRQVAEMGAGPEGDLTLVARLYERFLEGHPTSREVWEPLAGIYGRMGDLERLDRLIDETLDSLQSVTERNSLRLQKAKALMSMDGRIDDGVEVLRNILLEDPEHKEAQMMLVEYYERTGKEQDLIDLLQNNLMAAQGRKDVQAIKVMSLELGRRFEKTSPDEAVSIYRSALEWGPDDREILSALLRSLPFDHDPHEMAELMERLLSVEDKDKAPSLAVDLAELCMTLGNAEGMVRALEIGYTRAPGNAGLLARLEKIYEEKGNYSRLARVLADAAEKQQDPQQKVEMLLKVAAMHRDVLKDQGAALGILSRAAELRPGDLSIDVELVACMKAAGENQKAVEKISEILGIASLDQKLRFQLLRMRAAIRKGLGKEADAMIDLEEAFKIDSSVAGELEEILEKIAWTASQKEDYVGQRAATLRLFELADSRNKDEEAGRILGGWVDDHPKDIEALYMLRDFDSTKENWEGLAKTSSRLVETETGRKQIEAAMLMSTAYIKLGRAGEARQALEQARSQQPDSLEIRGELRRIYEAAGIKRELARLLLDDATTTDNVSEQVKMLRRAGELLTECGEVQEAIPIFKDIMGLEPGNLPTIVALADAYIISGKIEGADAILDEAMGELKGRRSPEMAALLHRKARIASARGELDTELQLMVQAFAMDRNNGPLAAELADFAEKIQNWDIAMKTLRSIALIEGPCPISRTQSYIRQARISLRTGDNQRAVFWAKKAQREEPTSPEVLALLAEVGET